MLTRGRLGAVALSLFSILSLACDEEANDTSGSGGSGAGSSSGPSSGGGGAGGGEDITHDAWSLTEGVAVELPQLLQAHALVAGFDGSIYVVGSDSDYLSTVVRLTADGDVASGWPLSTSSNVNLGYATHVTPLPDGAVAIATFSEVGGEWSIARVAADGSTLWNRSVPMSQNQYGMDWVATADSGVALLATSIGGGVVNQCALIGFDASGTPLPTYTAPNGDTDEDQILNCTAAELDPATGETLVLGYAQTDVSWTTQKALWPALHRVPQGFTAGTTQRNTHRGGMLTGSFSNGNNPALLALATAGDGTVFINEWTAASSGTHPTSVTSRFVAGQTGRDRWHADHTRMLPFGTGSLAALARQVLTTDPIEVSLMDTQYDEPFPVAATSFEPGTNGFISDMRVQGDAIWVLWQADYDPGPAVRVTRFDAATSVADGPAPEPEPPVDTHAVAELAGASTSAGSNGTLSRLVATADGGAYVLTRSGSTWSLDRIEASGALASGSWPHTFTFPSFPLELDTAAQPDVAVMSDGTAVVATVGQFGWVVRRLDLDGNQDWEAEYDSGPEDYPAGVLVDAQDRVIVYGSPGTYQGTPHVDCLALRITADGDFDDTFDVAVTETSTPAITRCRAAIIDGAGDVLFGGQTVVAHPLLGPQPGIGIARVSAAGAATLVGAAEADLFGPVLGGFGRPWLNEGNLLALADGGLVAAVSHSRTGSSQSRVVVVAADGDTASAGPWTFGTRDVALSSDGNVVVVHQETAFHPIVIEVHEVTANGLARVGGTSFDPPLGRGTVAAVSGGPGGTFWLALQNGTSQPALERFQITAP